MLVYTEVCPKLSVPGVGWITWKMLFISSLTGILSVPITKLNKASSGMPGDRGVCLYKRLSKPNELLYLPREI